MNNNSPAITLLVVGAFALAILGALFYYDLSLDRHPIDTVDGLIWRIDNAYDRVEDLVATLQITDESQPGEYVRVKVKYVKGPPSVLSMRYVPPEDANDSLFISSVGNETFIIRNDQLAHYIPSEDIMISKRWPGLPLVNIGRGFFDITQVGADWLAKRTEITILQDSGLSEIPSSVSLSVAEPFGHVASPFAPISVAVQSEESKSYVLCFSLCLETVETPSLGFAQSMLVGSESSIPSSHILEVRDAESKDLLRMIWVDRETYLIQKIVTFNSGQRSTTAEIQLITINQGLTESDVIAPPQDEGDDVENIRG